MKDVPQDSASGSECRTVMQERCADFESQAAGRRLHRSIFQSADDQPPRFGVLMVHGWGDHIACHRRAAELFVKHGGLAVGVDWPGNGRSTGVRGHMGGIDEAVAILRETLRTLREEMERSAGSDKAQDLPLLFYAHSTGAMLGLKFLAEIEEGAFRAVWLNSPLVRAEAGQAKWKRCVARLLAKVVPVLPLDTGVRARRCRRPDPQTGSFGDLSRCHPLVSAGFGDQLTRASELGAVTAWASALADPLRLLMTIGEDDTVCAPQFGRELFEELNLSEKTLISLSGFRHEPLLDHWWRDVIDEVEPWLLQVLR